MTDPEREKQTVENRQWQLRLAVLRALADTWTWDDDQCWERAWKDYFAERRSGVRVPG